MKKELGIVFCFAILIGCQKLKPESVKIPEYPDFRKLMSEQVELLGNSRIKKEVWLDGQREIRVLEMDFTRWTEELSFLKEINPGQPGYVGVFVKSGDELSQTLNLAEGENGSLKKVSFSKNDGTYENIEVSFHENKDVYVHHREIALNFEKGKLSSYQINGYQKIMFKDTVRFRISIEVN